MVTYAVAFLLSALTSALLTPAVRDFASRNELVDDPTEARKVHTLPIPRVGGVAIAAGFFVPILGLAFWYNPVSEALWADRSRVFGLLVGSVMAVGLGLVDDLRGLGPWRKLFGQLVIACFTYACGYQIEIIGLPSGHFLELGWMGLPVTIAWCVGIMNAMNLIDGLDGLATGIGLFAVVTLFLLSVIHPNLVVALSSICLAGALIGFLWFNFNPASIFMGDGGSLFLGYVLAVTAIAGSMKSSTLVSILIPILALGLPLMDMLLAVIRRILSGRSIFAADREHLHHKLLDVGLTHRQVVLVMYVAAVLLAFGALSLVYATRVQVALILGTIVWVAIGVSRALGYLTWSGVSDRFRYGLGRKRRLPEVLSRVRVAGEEMRGARDVAHLFSLLESAADDIGVDALYGEVEVEGVTGRRVVVWSIGKGTGPTGVTRLRFPIEWCHGDVYVRGELMFCWNYQADLVQVPEVALYDWLTMVVRDEVVRLCAVDFPLSDGEAREPT